MIQSQIRAEGALEDPTTLRLRNNAELNAEGPVQPEVQPGKLDGRPPDDAGQAEGADPSGTGAGNYGTPGPFRNRQSQ